MNTVNIKTASNSNIVGGDVTNSNMNVKTDSNSALNLKLDELNKYVGELVKKIPEQKKEQVLNDLKALTTEVVSSQPRNEHCQLSAKGILDVANTCAEMVNPISSAIKGIFDILSFTF